MYKRRDGIPVAQVVIYLTQQEKLELRIKAAQRGMTMNKYIKQLIEKENN